MSINTGDLVMHPMILTLGIGIVAKVVGPNICFVSWQGRTPTIETSSQLEVLSESR